MRSGWQTRSMVVAILFLVAGLLHHVSWAEPCPDPPLPPPGGGFGIPLPAAVRDMIAIEYPEFAAKFDILVYWDVDSPPETWPWPLYGEEGILAFIEAVMPPEDEFPGQDMYDHSVWWRVVKYFGLDVYPNSYDADPFHSFW